MSTKLIRVESVEKNFWTRGPPAFTEPIAGTSICIKGAGWRVDKRDVTNLLRDLDELRPYRVLVRVGRVADEHHSIDSLHGVDRIITGFHIAHERLARTGGKHGVLATLAVNPCTRLHAPCSERPQDVQPHLATCTSNENHFVHPFG